MSDQRALTQRQLTNTTVENPSPVVGRRACAEPGPDSSKEVSPKRATIVIVNYNGGQHLMHCLTSVCHDPHYPDYEVIVVDNASSDGSGARAAQRFAGVRVIHSGENLGFGGGNNVGAQQARGNYLAFLNPDTIVEPGWLEALIDALEADPAAGLATSKLLLLRDPERINTAGNEMHLTGLTLCRGMGAAHHQLALPDEVGAVSGAAFALRRQLFTSLGGFDADFFLYFEDTDLSWRARLAGYRCLYVPESLVYHDYRLHFGPHKTYFQERNRYRALLKVFRWPTLLLLAPALLLGEVVTWGFILLHDRRRWHNKLRAYRDVARHWPALMGQRRRVQALRRRPDRDLVRRASSRLAYEQTDGAAAARLAHLLFDPLFYLWQRVLLLFLWW